MYVYEVWKFEEMGNSKELISLGLYNTVSHAQDKLNLLDEEFKDWEQMKFFIQRRSVKNAP